MTFTRIKPALRVLVAGAAFLTYHASADQLIADDLIVQGSLGVGDDIENNHNFGFDTIVLRENNLRMFFEDTSNSGSFPGNNWRFIFNERDAGGASYFAVEDATAGRIPFKVEAGAPLNSLVVDSTGRVGVGTDAPALELHVTDGDSPALRLEQNASSGFTAQTWDLASNETNFFIRDVTNGSQLPFKIRPSAPTGSLDIKADGEVLFGNHVTINGGTSVGSAALHVNIDPLAGEGVIIGPNSGDDAVTANLATLHVEGTGYFSQTLEIGSTRESKERIRDITLEEAMQALDGLNPVQFHYIDDPASQLGFIAEDVPDLVATDGRRTVRPMDFVAVLAKVVKEHERREQDLLRTVNDQERRIEALSKRLERIEADALNPR